MGDYLEVLFATSAMIFLIAAATVMFGNRFGVLWRRIMWIIICFRMIFFYNPIGFVKLNVLPYSSINDFKVLNGQGYTGYGFFSKVPCVYFIFAAILLIGVVKIFIHNEEYGIFINGLIKNTERIHDEKVNTIFIKLCDELKISREIILYKSKVVNVPCIIGFRNIGIIVPENILNADDKTISNILRHELIHYQNKDVWYKRFVLLTSDLYWFDPAVYVMRYLANRDLEFYCDGILSKELSDEDKWQYCNDLLLVAAHTNNIFAMNFADSQKILKLRIDYIFKKDKKEYCKIPVPAALLVLMLLCMTDVKSHEIYKNNIIDANYLGNTIVSSYTRLRLQKDYGINVTIELVNKSDSNYMAYEDLNDNCYVTVNGSKEEDELIISQYITSFVGENIDIEFVR